MGKFNEGKGKEMPAVSTASLPDIIFMLLFFFIVTTIFKEKDTKVVVMAPIATEITKLDRRTDQVYYWIGKPSNKNYGTGYRVQVDDALAPDMGAIRSYLTERRGGDLSEVWDKVINNFKIDEKVNMRIVKNVQEELRNEDALKVAYTLKDKK